MGRGRPGSGGRRGRGGSGGGRSRGFRGGGHGRGGSNAPFSRKERTHYDQFGEQHPSEEIQDFGPSSSKQPRLENSRGGRGGRGRGGRGRGRGGFSDHNRRRNEDEGSGSSEESEEEEVTPYKELLSLFSKSKGGRDEVQIISDEEEEDDDSEQDDDEEVQTEKQNSSKTGKNKGLDNLEEEDDSGDDDEKESDHCDSQEEVENSTEANGENDKTALEDGSGSLVGDDKDEKIAAAEETVIEEAEIDPEMEDTGVQSTDGSIDPFLLHFEREMPELLQTHLKAERPEKVQVPCVWPVLDHLNYTGLKPEIVTEIDTEEESTGAGLSLLEKSKPVRIPGPPLNPPKKFGFDLFHIKSQFLPTLPITNQAVIDKENCTNTLTPLQTEIIALASQYHDIYYPMRTLENAEALRVAYCLHAANHILKTRTRILHHNAKMTNKVDVPDSYRDQGFVRAKILILVPFKDSALKIIKTLISLFLVEEKGNVVNKKRFLDEYGGTTLFLPKTNPKPDDYNATFEGNVDDNFKIGISLTKKTVKLYTGFYSADIIVASPLGLRLIIGAEGERDRDYDFLSSIELVIMDQADVFLMQNWDHILHLMRHLHLQPVTTHGTDFARIRPWALDGLTKYFSQTLVFSSIISPELSALMSKHCHNYAGLVRVQNALSKGSICQVTVQLPQVFQFFECASLQEQDDARFDFFVKKVMPTFTDKLMSHTLIFVSSYFDFVRLRNHFKREETGFVQICEYTKDKKVARARDYFFHGQSHFLLYTERVHFFRRFRLKGIGHIIFYQLPQYPHFYSELCNTIREDFQNRRVRQRKNSSVNVIYCKYDTPRLAAVVGSDRASHMLSSEKTVHAFVSGEL